MNLSRADIAAIIFLSSFVVVGGWAAMYPESWIRYVLKSRPEISPYHRHNQFIVRFIGICLIVLSAVCITATLKKR
jgi:hypothetical protein